MIIQESDEYLAKQQEQRTKVHAMIDEVAIARRPKIDYSLTTRPGEDKTAYHDAYERLAAMLMGDTSALSLKEAVYLSEAPYSKISWQEFDQAIQRMVAHIGLAMKDRGFSTEDNLAKNMMLYDFFTDTIQVQPSGYEKPVVSYPMLYDFQDFWGKEDHTKLFVSKLMQTGSGQCHSLPLLYMILAEEIGAESYLAFSPNHSYVKFQDDLKRWYNIELTNGMFTSDQFVLYSGFINAIALQNKMYTVPLTKREVIAQSVNDLANAYVAQFGYDPFVLQCTNLSLMHSTRSMTPHQLYNNYHATLLDKVIAQYRQYGLTQEEFERDEHVQKIVNQMSGVQKHLEKLGFADMPEEQYKDWLTSVQEEGEKQKHRTKMRQLLNQIND
ncbi:MAG: hypothetical protein AAF693_12825 [Bacteroidota bacterium]